MEVRRKVSELKVGDEVKGYGVLKWVVDYGDGCVLMVSTIQDPCTDAGEADGWPIDAEVTVIAPDTEYRITVTYISRDRHALDRIWPADTQCDGWINPKVKRTVGEIEEVTL